MSHLSRYRPLVITLLIAFLFVTACASPEPQVVYYERSAALDSAEFAAEPAAVAAQSAVPPASVERLIIRSANLTLVVRDPGASLGAMAAVAEEAGGWIVSSNLFTTSSTTNTRRGELSLRVPSDQFDAVVNSLKADVVEVRSESTSGEDVTEEYIDLSARLRNLEQTQTRVRGFLDEARNVEEALAVNQELSRLEEQIELLKGRIQYLDQSVAYSRIDVTLLADADAQPIEIGGWRPTGTARAALQFLIDLLQWLVDVVIWLVIVGIPSLLVLAGVTWVVRRLRAMGWFPRWPRRRRRGTGSDESSAT